MKYQPSSLDRSLANWFTNDNAHANLRGIHLKSGRIRGLSPMQIAIDYPITVIAGKNGSGKSTLLALAACAFHNVAEGFPHKSGKATYYTFADFFIQSKEDVPVHGIKVWFHIAHDNWNATPPDGLGWQERKKRSGGRWNDYDKRVDRNVVFLGIDRIVPHTEKGTSRSYSHRFKATEAATWEDSVRKAVGFVLGRDYSALTFTTHSSYRLPVVTIKGTKYSGFNMGAGENALIELFATIHAVGEGALIVVDEIELGLHIEAQKRLIRTLKKLCLQQKVQIICTSHSSEVFGCVPPNARVFLERQGRSTAVLTEVSAEYAFHKLSANTDGEVDVLVEDNTAQRIICTVLPATLRTRINIEQVGSATVLVRQLASIYLRKQGRPTLVVLDGDQRSKRASNLKYFKNMTETKGKKLERWFDDHVLYLPGDTWPENWLLGAAEDDLEYLAGVLNCEEDMLEEAIELGHQAGKHSEFHAMGAHLGVSAETVLEKCSLNVLETCSDEFEDIVGKLNEILSEA